jgi:hypothetical protein
VKMKALSFPLGSAQPPVYQALLLRGIDNVQLSPARKGGVAPVHFVNHPELDSLSRYMRP